MKIRIKKGDFNTLKIADEESEIVFKKLEYGIVYEVDIKKTRNPQYHRKFFKLLNTGLQNTKSKIDNLEFYREVMLIKAGYVNILEDKGTTYVFAKSIAFDKMDNLEFEKVYNAVFNQIIIDIEADEELFTRELSGF